MVLSVNILLIISIRAVADGKVRPKGKHIFSEGGDYGPTRISKQSTDCNNIYYLCTQLLNDRVWLKYSCALGCCFDTNLLHCVCKKEGRWKYNGEKHPRFYYEDAEEIPEGPCKDAMEPWWIIRPTTPEVSTTKKPTTTRQPIVTTTDIITSTTVQTCQTGKFVCPIEPRKGATYPDPNDCRYFFSCWSLGAYRDDCGVSNHFEGGKCNTGNCLSAVPGCKPLEQERECQTGYRECPPGSDQRMYHDENDCRYYFVCLKEAGIMRHDCGERKHYRAIAGKCVDGPCPFALPDCNPQEAGRPCETGKFVCPTEPRKGATYPDPNNCRYFFSCWSLGAYRNDCGAGKHYEGGKCVDGNCLSAVPNCNPLDQERECLTGYRECPPGSDRKMYHDENDCRYYFVCMDAQVIIRRDCGEGKHFSSTKGKCVDGPCPFALPNCKPQEAGRPCETGKFVCPTAPRKGATYPDPNNCRYFFSCWSLGAYRDDCGGGKHYEGGKCVDGNCLSAVPNCNPLDQERECLTGYRECQPGSNRRMYHDQNDCRYYFVCLDAQGITRHDCGEGKHYRAVAGKCVHGPCPFALPGCEPQEAGRPCETGKFVCPAEPRKGATYPDPNNCRYFFSCWSLGAYRDDCGAGNHFENGKCVDGDCLSAVRNCEPLDQDRECQTGYRECPPGSDRKMFHDENDCRYYFVCLKGRIIRHDCGEGRHYKAGKCWHNPCPFALPGCKPQEAGRPCETGKFVCPTEPRRGATYPDPNNCRYFFSCWSLGAYRDDCGSGKHFENGKCVDGDCLSAVPNCKPLDQERECLTGHRECMPGNDGRMYHDENDCRYYFVCLKDGIVRHDCGDGKHYRAVAGKCVHGHCPFALPGCKPQEAGKPCETGKFVCPTEPRNGATYPDPNNCRYFFSCLSLGAYRDDCGVGNHFEDGKCVAGNCLSAVPNCKPLDQERECITGYRECPPGSDGRMYHDENDCRYYFVCSEEQGKIRHDCGEGKHYAAGKCVDGSCPFALPGCEPQEAGRPCVQGKFVCPTEPRIGNRHADPNNCRYYFSCWPSGAYRHDCGAGKHFEGGKCNVGNCLSAVPNCNPLDQQRECITGIRACPTNIRNDQKMYHDENDCRYYFICLRGRITRHDCGEGRHFEERSCLPNSCSFALLGCQPQFPESGQIY